MADKRKPRTSIAGSATRSMDRAARALRRNPWPGAALLAAIGAIGGFLIARGRTPAGRRDDAVPSPDAPASGTTALHSAAATATASGHPAPDLEGDRHPGPGDRADPQFRPDIDAPMSAEDRAALTPPTLPLVRTADA